MDLDSANGEWIGMLMLSQKGAAAMKDHADALADDAALTDLLQALVDKGLTVNTIDTYKGWMEIDTFEDYQRAWAQL